MRNMVAAIEELEAGGGRVFDGPTNEVFETKFCAKRNDRLLLVPHQYAFDLFGCSRLSRWSLSYVLVSDSAAQLRSIQLSA